MKTYEARYAIKSARSSSFFKPENQMVRRHGAWQRHAEPLPDTCKHHLGAWNVGLGVEQVLEQVLLGPATTIQNYGKTGTDRDGRNAEGSRRGVVLRVRELEFNSAMTRDAFSYQVMPEFLLAAE